MIKNKDNIPANSEPLEKIFPKGPGKKNASLMIIHLLCPLVRTIIITITKAESGELPGSGYHKLAIQMHNLHTKP